MPNKKYKTGYKVKSAKPKKKVIRKKRGKR